MSKKFRRRRQRVLIGICFHGSIVASSIFLLAFVSSLRGLLLHRASPAVASFVVAQLPSATTIRSNRDRGQKYRTYHGRFMPVVWMETRGGGQSDSDFDWSRPEVRTAVSTPGRNDGDLDNDRSMPEFLSHPSPNYNNAAEMALHETVQDRVDSWRHAQLAQSLRLQQSVRDDQGRLKLLTGVSRGSRAIIFVCLVFRNLHLFEVADQALRGIARLLVVTPLIGLFVANLAGVVASFTAPSHSSKKRLKAILNLDKLLEFLLIVWNIFRLTVAPSRLVPREVFVSNTLHSVFFILQCQAFTRLAWDENAAPPPGAMKDLSTKAAAFTPAPLQQPPSVNDDGMFDPTSERWHGGRDDPSVGGEEATRIVSYARSSAFQGEPPSQR